MVLGPCFMFNLLLPAKQQFENDDNAIITLIQPNWPKS
jgi:hypothetical protein